MLWLENLLSQGTVERLGWTLVHFLWQAAVVTLLLAAFLRLLRKSSANVRYLTACAALMLMVVLPVATMQFIEVPGPAAEAGPEPGPPMTAAPLPPTTVRMPGQTFTPSDVPPDTADMTAPVPWRERIASLLEPALPYAVLGWLAGVFGLSAWHLGGWMQLQRLKRRMVHSVSSALQQRMAQIAVRLGVYRAVTLLESALVEVPTVVGWLRPVVLLPASALTGLSPGQLEAILAHELAHIHRYDYLVNVLQTVVEILGFYHPAVWWVSRRIRIERENCCDDVAVGLCGDSVRYARALTCLEEIRHGRAELAMAATGGSLLDRIARLLGRPATDDRRFAWLPGLITLLLVAGILIPTALTLTAAGSLQSRGSPAGEPTPTEDIEAPREPKQILLNVVVTQVASDQTLDRDTAIQARALLATAAAEGNTGVPPVEEFEKPLRQIIGKYVTGRTLTGDNAEAFIHLLIATGHARVVTRPSVLTLEGQHARIVIGEDPNRETPGASSGAGTFHVSLEATATIQDDPNTILLSMGFHMENLVLYPHTDPGPIVKAKVADFRTVEAFRNKEYRILPLSVSADPGGDSVPVPTNTLVLLIRATIAKEPAASPASEPNAPRIDLRTEIAGEPNALMADDAHVMIKVKIIEAVDGNELNRETVTQIENLLGKRVRPEGRAGEFGPRLHMTVGEILRGHVVQQLLPNETVEALVEMLAAKGHIKVLAAPAVVARDGKQSQVKVTNDEYFRMGSSTDGSQQDTELQKIEVGTILDVTPHVKDPNTIFMEIKVELSDIVPGPGNGIPPVISRRTVAAAVTTLSGRCVTLAGMTENNTSAQAKDSKSLYVIMMPTVIKPQPIPEAANAPADWQIAGTSRIRLNYIGAEQARNLLSSAFQPYVKPEPAGSTDPNSHALIVTAPRAIADRIAAEIRVMDIRPRYVLLEVRIVAMERRDLPGLGIEWTQANTDRLGTASTSEPGTWIGLLPSRVSSDSLLAKLDLLNQDNRANILSNPKFTAREGHQSRIQPIIEEYFLALDPRMYMAIREMGILLITPHISDDNDISFDVAYDINNRASRNRDPNSPTVRSEVQTNTIAIHDGGTAVLVMPEKNAREAGDSKRIIAVFITARLARDSDGVAPGLSEAKEAKGEATLHNAAKQVRRSPLTFVVSEDSGGCAQESPRRRGCHMTSPDLAGGGPTGCGCLLRPAATCSPAALGWGFPNKPDLSRDFCGPA